MSLYCYYVFPCVVISGSTCERRIKNIPFKPLSERMMEEPFWLGLLAVFVVLGILGTGYMLKKHLPEKFDKYLQEGGSDGNGKNKKDRTATYTGGHGSTGGMYFLIHFKTIFIIIIFYNETMINHQELMVIIITNYVILLIPNTNTIGSPTWIRLTLALTLFSELSHFYFRFEKNFFKKNQNFSVQMRGKLLTPKTKSTVSNVYVVTSSSTSLYYALSMWDILYEYSSEQTFGTISIQS